MKPENPAPEGLTRRDFLYLGAACAAAAGCQATSETGGTAPGARGTRVVDAGPAGALGGDGVITTFRSEGFFLIHRAGRPVALSSICTHRQCKLSSEPDRSFHCDCHGSTFDPAGKVTHGPATRDLPLLATQLDARGHLLVTVPA